jgi:hypothetical protein
VNGSYLQPGQWSGVALVFVGLGARMRARVALLVALRVSCAVSQAFKYF